MTVPVQTAPPHAAIGLRPQPVGLLPGMAGLLLLPPAGDRSRLDAMLRGDDLTHLGEGQVPAAWAFRVAAARGDVEGALAGCGSGPLADYNRFVLAPSPEGLARLESELGGELRVLLQVAAFTAGLRDEPPPDTALLDGELRALSLAARAAWHLERADVAAAAAALERAMTSAAGMVPAFAAQLQAQLASLRPDLASAARELRGAIERAAGCDDLRAALFTDLGMLYQERGGNTRAALGEAVKAYQEAIHAGHDATRRPELFALLQNNIGLAYLAMPMIEASEPLRFAIAVQSFREACRVVSRETQPELWTSAHLNLANVLQYVPSSHPAENLAKAVEIYESLLEVRDRERDPVGYARVLANQANALAHLGGLVVALAKFREARGLAQAAGATDLAASLEEQIDRVEAHRSRRKEGEGTAAGGTAT